MVLKYSRMKTKMVWKGTMVVGVLWVGAAFGASTPGVGCEGNITAQHGEAIMGITVTTVSGPSVSATTDVLECYGILDNPNMGVNKSFGRDA